MTIINDLPDNNELFLPYKHQVKGMPGVYFSNCKIWQTLSMSAVMKKGITLAIKALYIVAFLLLRMLKNHRANFNNCKYPWVTIVFEGPFYSIKTA